MGSNEHPQSDPRPAPHPTSTSPDDADSHSVDKEPTSSNVRVYERPQRNFLTGSVLGLVIALIVIAVLVFLVLQLVF
jgi:hypothetical protein